MRIERINENSIRCVLTNFDLSVRNVKISELTYGSEKARNLFREMMQKASAEIGFEAEDIPIMVEAIPMPNDSIMLIITKIDDPDELDTRFSRFAPAAEEDDSFWNNFTSELLEGALAAVNQPDFPPEKDSKNLQSEMTSANETPSKSPQNIRIYQFPNLDLVCAAAKETDTLFTGESILYKNPVNEKFYLVLKRESCEEFAFSKTCNKLSEYAVHQKYEPAAEAYFTEHYELFVKKNALQVLANI